jgi:hypothetical protein
MTQALYAHMNNKRKKKEKKKENESKFYLESVVVCYTLLEQAT